MQAESGTEPRVADDVERHPPPARRAPRPLTLRQALLLVLALVVTIIVADQLTKAWITARYGPCGNLTFTPVIGHYAGFSYVCNNGTAFSRFQDTPLVWVPVLIAVGAVAWLWFRSLTAPQLLQQIAFGMIIGGAIGNVIDRRRLGYVVDFIDLRLNDHLRFYVFNVADSCISIGVVVLALAFWRAEAARPREGEAEAGGD